MSRDDSTERPAADRDQPGSGDTRPSPHDREQSARDRALRDLAAAIARHRLTTPARLFLDMFQPVPFLASQLATFARPFVPEGRWRDYVLALEDEGSWKALRGIVDAQES